MNFQLETNSSELQRLYNKRANSLQHYSNIVPTIWAQSIHVIRLRNLDVMIYQKSPYSGTNRPLKGDLRAGEKVRGDTAYNDSDHAASRHEMGGRYSSNGNSREAKWVNKSVEDFQPIKTMTEQSIQRNILEGRISSI